MARGENGTGYVINPNKYSIVESSNEEDVYAKRDAVASNSSQKIKNIVKSKEKDVPDSIKTALKDIDKVLLHGGGNYDLQSLNKLDKHLSDMVKVIKGSVDPEKMMQGIHALNKDAQSSGNVLMKKAGKITAEAISEEVKQYGLDKGPFDKFKEGICGFLEAIAGAVKSAIKTLTQGVTKVVEKIKDTLSSDGNRVAMSDSGMRGGTPNNGRGSALEGR